MTATTTAIDLTGIQKAAVVLMQLGQSAAVEVMKHLSETEAEEVAAEIVRLRRVSPEVAERVMEEFHTLSISGRTPARGGQELAEGLLEGAFGAEKASGLLGRMNATLAGRSFEFLEDAEPGQLLGILDGELPQTIALVLAHLRPAAASAVIAGLPEGTRTEVAHAIATMSPAAPEAVTIVSDVLKVRAGAVVAPREAAEVVGGVQPLVDIINRSDVATEKALLAGLDELDPLLAEEVRSRMLTFADIVKLDAPHIQSILRSLDLRVLATAMKGAPAQVTEAIYKNISERKRENLDAEIANLGPVRMKAVEEARSEIVRQIREREAAGDIDVRRGEEDEFVH